MRSLVARNGAARAWQVDKGWSDTLLPQIKGILGQQLLMAAPQEEDVEHATDLMAISLTLPTRLRVACRVRRGDQLRRDTAFGEEFTIRSGRPNGVKTELAKVLEGWGSHLFYGFADNDLLCWMLGDLNVFRLWFVRWMATHGGALPGKEIMNRDQSSRFLAIPIADLPPGFVLARQLPPDGLRWTGGYVGDNPIDLEGVDAPVAGYTQARLL